MQREATGGALWGIGGQAVQFAVYVAGYILLARNLDKAELGLAAMVLVVVAFLGCAADLGMGVVAVQRRSVSDRRANGIAIASGAALCLLVALLAPRIGAAYRGAAGFVPLLRAGAAALLIAGCAANARARLQRTLSFRSLVLVDVGAEVARAAARVGFAMNGFGAWSIVLGDLIALCLGAAAAWLVAPPMRRRGDRDLVADGVRIVGARAADSAQGQADRFTVGSVWGSAGLGLYGFAYQHTLAALQRLSAVAELVALPILSRLQDDPRRLATAYLTLTRVYSLAVAAAAGLLHLYAGPLVGLLYPERWQEAVPALRALTFAMATAGFNSHPGLVWIALGRMRLRMAWSLVNLVAVAAALAIGARYSVEAIAYALAIRSLLATFAAQGVTWRVAGVSHLAYMRAVAPAVVLWLLLVALG